MLFVVGMGLASCSDLKDPLNPNKEAVISDVHPADWQQVGAQGFHGKFVADSLNFDFDNCQQCHGQNFAGGITNTSCLDCHQAALLIHPAGWLTDNSPDFHGKFLQNAGWNLTDCQRCHGQNYAGGASNSSCLTCHPGTPEACTVCHGGTDNQTGAPPIDLADNSDIGDRGVGQHTLHLSGGSLSSPFECASCHVVPTSFFAAGHVDSQLPAELTFGGLAVADGAAPNYNGATLSCANSYCHGNWSLPRAQSQFNGFYIADFIQGSAEAPIWTDAATGECGTCHALPPTGHVPANITGCDNCHSGVVDNDGNIIDKTKHVNGMVNVFGQEYPMF